jgi:hypothetical protein
MVAHQTAMASEGQPGLIRSISAQALAFPNSEPLASAGALANAMQQFDAYGTPLLANASSVANMYADPAKKPQMTDPLSSGMLAVSTVKG